MAVEPPPLRQVLRSGRGKLLGLASRLVVKINMDMVAIRVEDIDLSDAKPFNLDQFGVDISRLQMLAETQPNRLP